MEGDDYLTTLAEKTKEEIMKTVTSENTIMNKNLLKSIVSKKKIRWEYEGFSLDLSYITTNIIAMGFPAKNFESLYRNDITHVLRFFEKRHKGNYKVYNLCMEKDYPDNTFEKQAKYPFVDHHAPPLDIILPFCIDVDNWLKENPQNVAAIHCKAGKGRTGTFIACYLLYAKIINNAEDAMKYFGMMRTLNARGVTIPSQMRYVYYFDHIMKVSTNLIQPKCIITKIKVLTVPNIGNGGCCPYFVITCGGNIYKSKNEHKLTTYRSNLAGMEFHIKDLAIIGDVKIEFFNKKTIGKDKMFKIMFNTNFIPNDGIFVVKKSMLDYACKDHENKIFDPQLKVEIHYIIDEEIIN